MNSTPRPQRALCALCVRAQTLGKVIRVYPSTVIAPLLVTACMLGLGLSGMQLASNFYAKSSQVVKGRGCGARRRWVP